MGSETENIKNFIKHNIHGDIKRIVSSPRMLHDSYADMAEPSLASSPETAVAETQASPELLNCEPM